MSRKPTLTPMQMMWNDLMAMPVSSRDPCARFSPLSVNVWIEALLKYDPLARRIVGVSSQPNGRRVFTYRATLGHREEVQREKMTFVFYNQREAAGA